MVMFKNVFAFFAIMMVATGAFAQFKVFDNTAACEIARVNNLGPAYVPVTKAPFKGGPGWTEHVVPAGGACLGGAYVMEDGVPVKGKTVYVAEGFRYWRHTSGAFRMHECSNPFEQLVLLRKEEPKVATPPPVPPAPVASAPCTDCDKPTVATSPAQVQVPIDIIVTPRVTVQQPTVTTPCCVQVPQVPQAPVAVYTPPVPMPTVPAQPQGCPGGNCIPQAQVLGQEPAPHGICGIRAVDRSGQTVGLIQIDNYQGKVRIAKVGQWGARPLGPRSVVVTDVLSSPRRNCDDDQGQVERHWAQVIRMLGLPLDCTPAGRPRVQL